MFEAVPTVHANASPIEISDMEKGDKLEISVNIYGKIYLFIGIMAEGKKNRGLKFAPQGAFPRTEHRKTELIKAVVRFCHGCNINFFGFSRPFN